jgi:hypothetical protein
MHARRYHNAARPWSLLRTPVALNPRDERIQGGVVPYEVALEDYRALMADPKPFSFVESGFVIWEGPSPVDGAPLVAIVTGVSDSASSDNIKTGVMLQTWIMRRDISPQEAVDTGGDRSICGDCSHRGHELPVPVVKKRKLITPKEAALGVGIDVGPKTREGKVEVTWGGRTCYVVVAQAPMAVWKKYHRSRAEGFQGMDGNQPVYRKLSPDQLPALGWGRLVRLGSYGDPAMVPLHVWDALTHDSLGWTGYTHQWCHEAAQPYKRYLMASVDNEREMREARAMGWRPFRVLRGDEQLVAGHEMQCPAAEEGGSKKTCDSCRACQGIMPGKPRFDLPREEKWRERPGVPGVALKVHPRFQIVYSARPGNDKRGKLKSRVRSHKVGNDTKADPKLRPTEVVLIDYLAATQMKPLLAELRKIAKLKTHGEREAAVLELGYAQPKYLQGYFQRAADVIARLPRVKRDLPAAQQNPLAQSLCSRCHDEMAPMTHGPFCERCKREVAGEVVRVGRKVRANPEDVQELIEDARELLREGVTHGMLARELRNKHGRNDALVEALIQATRPAPPPMAPPGVYGPRPLPPGAWVSANPRTPAQLRRLISQKQIELEDAEYFGYAAPKIASLRKDLRLLHEELADAEGSFDAGVRKGLAATRREQERDSWQRQLRKNPLLAIVGNPARDAQLKADLQALIRERKALPRFGLSASEKKKVSAKRRAIEKKEQPLLRKLRKLIGEHEADLWFVRQNPYRDEMSVGFPGSVMAWTPGSRQSRPKRVAGADDNGRVKSRGKKKARKKASKKKPSKVKKNRVASPGKKKPTLKPKRKLSVEEGTRRFEGMEEARAVYDEFHGKQHPPRGVDVYEFDDGLDEVRVEPIQVALHRTLETNYVVPWSSSKKGTLWLHEHKEGAGLRGLQKGAAMPNPDDLPLEVYDPWTQTTRKFGGRFQIRDWWYD